MKHAVLHICEIELLVCHKLRLIQVWRWY